MIKSYNVLKLFSIFNINSNKNFLLRPFIIKISIVMRRFVCLFCFVSLPAMFGSTQGHPVSGFWPSWKCQSWLLCWHGLQVRPVIGWPLPQALSHHCHSTSCRPEGRIGCRLKVLWLGGCSSPTTGKTLPGYRR